MNIQTIRTALLRLSLALIALTGSLVTETQATSLPGVQTRALAATNLAVTVQAASGRTTIFEVQKAPWADQGAAHPRVVPHLVLYRNGVLSDPSERTLTIDVTGITVPPRGVTVTLTIETQHAAFNPTGVRGSRIVAWRASQVISNTRGVTMTQSSAHFEHRFAATVQAGDERIRTPTDYFRYEITVLDRKHPGTRPRQTLALDHAFLMENQWIAPLPQVREQMEGAAPDELIVHYCDMFPFGLNAKNPSTWLAREEVSDYVGSELVPAMVEAFRIQSEEWGLLWHRAWTSFRPKDGRRLSVALSEGETWFHGPAPVRAHAGISLNLNGGFADYDSLTDGVMSHFHHELFHNLQRSLHQHHGGDGQVGGKDKAWEVFSEGTAVLASAVGQPDIQFPRKPSRRTYLSNARSFLGREGFTGGSLNRSYEAMVGYHATVYWRFLYEQCGGMVDGTEDPAAGMAVIWRSLEILYSAEAVDMSSSTALVENMPGIIDRALAEASCPFETHEQSLLAFSRAIYGLRVEGGRCVAPGAEDRCGFYDPGGLYHAPPRSTITYRGQTVDYGAADQPYPAGIPRSFGIDLIEIALETRAGEQALAIEFYGSQDAEAQFAVQVWKLGAHGESWNTQPAAQVISQGPDRKLVYLMSERELARYDRLGLAITRLDARENLDQEGTYTLSLHPAEGIEGPASGLLQ